MPTETVSVREVFGINSDLRVPAFAERDEHVPEIDPAYQFNPEVTLAILAGFTHNRRVMIQGMHGTGKSTHIEQIAARLNWPCLRINLDGHVSRLDLVGKDTIQLEGDKQVTAFQEGIIPWSLQRPVALIFDEYEPGLYTLSVVNANGLHLSTYPTDTFMYNKIKDNEYWVWPGLNGYNKNKN